MSESALYYALSTIAQCGAALAALIGFFGLWRLDRLRDQQAALERYLRRLLVDRGFSEPDTMALPIARIIQATRSVADGTWSHPGAPEVRAKCQRIVPQWGDLQGQQRRLMVVLISFLLGTLVLLAAAIVGIACVKQLENLTWPLWLVYVASVWLAGAPVYVVWQAARSSP